MKSIDYKFKKFAKSRIEYIKFEVARECGITIDEMVSIKRHRKFSYARGLAMWLCRYLIGVPFIEIGKSFGNRDHSTVMTAIAKCEKECRSHESYYGSIREKLVIEFEKKYGC